MIIMESTKLYFAEGCRLCDAVMSQLDELGAKYDAVEVEENATGDGWIIIDETSPVRGKEISSQIMKGVPALFQPQPGKPDVMIIGYQIGAVIGQYKSILMKKKKKALNNG